jgi:uncharacterized delta-60 repeat protein
MVNSTPQPGPLPKREAGRIWLHLCAVLSLLIGVPAARSQTADSFNAGASDGVTALAVQADGRVVAGGVFTTLSGATRMHLGRLNPDGTLDTAFYPGTDFAVNCVAVQADGKILVGGAFTTLGGQTRKYLGRLNANGSLDTSFHPDASGTVDALAVQPDGMILVAGAFTNLAGQACLGLGRLYPDGSLDTGFNSSAGTEIYTLAVQPDGGIVVGGTFTTLAGQPRLRIGRLGSDGSLDYSFNPGASSYVRCVLVQPDGGILVAGDFTTLGGQTHQCLGRLSSDGSLDTNFTATANTSVYALALQTDGKVLVGGAFGTLAGGSRALIGRLNANGSLDTAFTSSAGGTVRALALQADGKALVGGYFTTLAGTSRSRLGRLNNNTAATQSLTTDGSSVTWLRGGSSPQVSAVTFDASSNGTDWTSLGSGSRIDGGWQLTGVTVGANDTVRARAQAVGGCYSGCGWYLESGLGPPAISLQPQDAVGHTYDYVSFSVVAAGAGPLGYQWFKDGVAVAGATNSWQLISYPSASSSGSTYTVLVTNALGGVRSADARLWALGTDSFNPAPVGKAYALAVQTDGKVLLGGSFTNMAGGTRNNLARLNANGTLDSSFNPGANGGVTCFAVQPDGSILVGGSFTTLGGQTHRGLGRLNASGNVDSTFNPSLGDPYFPAVYCLGIQPDGMIVLGGTFSSLNGQARACIGRLYADGTLDTSFVTTNFIGSGLPPTGGVISSLAIEPDGGILAFGSIPYPIHPNYHYYGERLGQDGSVTGHLFPLDIGYNDTYAIACAQQADGKVVVGGIFDYLGHYTYLARLNSEGSQDSQFSPVLNGMVTALAVQSDGRILAAGSFTSVNGLAHTNLCRLNPDGSVDPAFDSAFGASGTVYTLAPQQDGKLLVGGTFTTLAGVIRNNVGRLTATGPATESLSDDGSSITWLRSGSSGEFWRTTFDSSTDGTNWTSQGAGANISGGWQLGGVWLTDGSLLRGRGVVTGSGMSSWTVETITSSPTVTNQPMNLTNNAGTLAVIRAGVTGAPPLSCQWLRNGVALSDGASAVGSQTSLLMLNGVFGPDAGSYSLIVTNPYGSVTSLVAVLSVIDPLITAQPASRTNNAGTTATFSVTALRSTPMSCQWLKNGTALTDGGNVAGALTPLLTLTNVLGGDGGSYTVVISNAYGSVTSAVATLSVLDPLIRTLPTSPWANVGDALTLTVDTIGTAPLRYQWRKDGAALLGGTDSALSLTSVQATNAGTYSVIVTNVFGRATGTVATLGVNQATADTLDAGADYAVYATAIQTDGKVLVGGAFTNLAGQPRLGLGRFNANGALDTSFNPGVTGGSFFVNALALQPDGTILVGGQFATLAGQPCTNFGRLKADGTLDPTFTSGTDFNVNGFLPLPDGKILIWGAFGIVNGQPCCGLGRLNPNGTLDASFNAGVSGAVYCVALQPDGKLLVGGSISGLGGQACNYFGRLNTNLTLETAFNPNLLDVVAALAVQPDGKILLGGYFLDLGGQPRTYLGRLNSDGTLDGGFHPAVGGGCSTSRVLSLALQADGRIILGGGFGTLGGNSRNCLGRLNADGTLDSTFNPGVSRSVYCPLVYALGIGADGKVVAGGAFSTLGGQARGNLGRLNSTEAATQTLALNGSTITWTRGGTSPGFWRASFDVSTNGTDWASLGSGTCTTNGVWQVPVASLPINATVRARGFVCGGFQNGSGWFTESTFQPPSRPSILANDGGLGFRTNQFRFNVQAVQGQVVVIEASTNFVNWVPLQTNVTTALGQIIFSDAASGLFRRRFYRAELYQGTLPPPAILLRDGALGFRTNRFGFTLNGIGGQTLVIEASTNLANWSPLVTNTLDNGPFYFSDPAAGTYPRRFYRAR